MWQFEALNWCNEEKQPAPNYHKQNVKTALIIAVIVSIVVVGGILVGIFAPDFKEEARQVYNYCQSDENYITVTGTLDQLDYRTYNGFIFTLTGEDKEFEVYSQSSNVLRNNNFHRDVTIGKSQLTVTFSKYDFFGDIPVVAIYMDGKCYLDFETGKANLLEYIDKYING